MAATENSKVMGRPPKRRGGAAAVNVTLPARLYRRVKREQARRGISMPALVAEMFDRALRS